MTGYLSSRAGGIARFAGAAVVSIAILALTMVRPAAGEQDKVDPAKKDGQPPAATKTKVTVNLPKAYQGYTLIFPMNSTKTQLIDMEGRVVRTWDSAGSPAMSTYLLPNGDLLRPVASGGGMGGGRGGPGGGGPGGGGPGGGGRIQQFSFDGELLWDYTFKGDKYHPHHDITPIIKDKKLASVLVVAGETKTAQEATAAGRKSGNGFQVDCILEIKPSGKTTGEIVWEWHAWDHLIQDSDKTKANAGNVAEHPELIDVNFSGGFAGMGGPGGPGGGRGGPGGPGGGMGGGPGGDWTHVNSVVYNDDLEQVMISVHGFSELWVIDHSTTKAEAASHKGGRYGKGGDLLYRWGNPQAYRAGTDKDRQLFTQHDAHWIPKGYPGAGHILMFNNGVGRPGGNYSSVEEIVPPMNDKGVYALKPGAAYGPDKPVWSYAAPNKTELFSMAMSGVQRLPNGNTLICEAMSGKIIEVTAEKELVWRYGNSAQGGPGGMGPGGPGGMGPGGPGGMGGGFGGGGGMGGLFRAYRYGPDYPGLAGRTLEADKK